MPTKHPDNLSRSIRALARSDAMDLCMVCKACGAENSVDARTCRGCGCELVAHCLECKATVQTGARFCSACGKPLFSKSPEKIQTAQENPMGLVGARKQVTILFADFCGFTTFSAQLDPEDLRDTLNTIWANLDAIILTHGGTPEKHSGDAVMAVFGGWRSREEDPAEAVRAALAMQEWLKDGIPGAGQKPLQMRIGIHTGLVVVGPADHKGEFLATGDTVNMASRLESNAPDGQVVISRETYRHVYGFFDVNSLPLLTVKGKSEPVETYLILRAKPRGVALQLRGIEGVETELIGREADLAHLQTTFKKAMDYCSPQLLTIVGEAGIGKSRLLREFQKWTDLLPEFLRIFSSRATTETRRLPFALIRDLFSTRFEVKESDPAAVAREKFEIGLAGYLGVNPETGDWSREKLLPDIHFVGQLLGLDFSASPYLRDFISDAEQMRQRAFHGFSRLLTAIWKCPATDQTPKSSAIVLVLEDLHWSDDGSLGLIEHLIRTCRELPLIILTSARPNFLERQESWCADVSNAGRMNLNPLSSVESNALVETLLLKAGEIPGTLRELVTEGAEGNPFYIEEMIKMLMDQKVIVPGSGNWRIDLGQLANARVPSTLTGVLQARLDGLAPEERLVLQRASVVGRIFWDSAVAQMGLAEGPDRASISPMERELSKNEVQEALKGLRRKELVYRSESSSFAGSEEYLFKHELLRNVAYESLLKKSRRQHHGRIAGWLKDRSGDRMAEFAGLVATHFEQASRLAEAAEWHGRAGQQARLGYAPAIATEHFKKALQLLPRERTAEPQIQKQQLEWQEGLAESLGAQADFSEALEACTAMQTLAQTLGDAVAQARAWNGMAYLHERRGDNRASIQCAEKAEAVASENSEPARAELVRALNLKGWAYYRLSDASAVLRIGEQTMTLCMKQGNRRGTAMSLKLLGVANLQLGRYLEADQFFKEGLELFHELGDRRNAAAMWNNRAETARARGAYQAAADLYTKALAVAREIGHRESELIYLANLGADQVELRDYAEAEMNLHQVIEQTTSPNSCTLSEAFSFLSEACLQQGRLAEALEAARRAITLAKESENSLFLGGAWRALGRCATRTTANASKPGDWASTQDQPAPTASECFAESLRVFQEIKAEGEQARTLRAWGEQELETGDLESGRKKLDQARDIFQRLGATFEVAAT